MGLGFGSERQSFVLELLYQQASTSGFVGSKLLLGV